MHAAFSAIADNHDTLIAEMGEPASAAAAAEAARRDMQATLPG